MIKKSPLIRAMMKVASEYNDNSHRLDMNTCAMCNLYRDNIEGDCGSCPMRTAFRACGRRWCSPVECITQSGKKKTAKDHLNHLEATKEFYYKTIARVRRMTVKELNEYRAFDFMYEIDRKVGKKYGLIKQDSPWEI
jgi:hypothetical protein